MSYTTKEKLVAILILETVKNAGLTEDGIHQALRLASEYANTGSDMTVLGVLEYPDTKRGNK